MRSSHIKKILVGLAACISLNAEAAVLQFMESFSGMLAESVVMDTGYFSGQSTFMNTTASLTTHHEVFNFLPDFYIAIGSFSRTDSAGTLEGMFELVSQLPDYQDPNMPDPNVLLTGTFYSQSLGGLENTGAYANSFFMGVASGYLSGQILNLSIDWTIVTPDGLSAVPAPPPAWLYGFGVLVLALAVRRKHYKPAHVGHANESDNMQKLAVCSQLGG